MIKVITDLTAKVADRVLKMKPTTKIVLGVATAATATAAGALAVKAVQAKQQNRSVKSLVVEDAMRRLPSRANEQDDYEKALEQSALPYSLPDFARKTIGFSEYDDFDDTFIIMPKEQYSDFVIFYIHGHDFWADPSKVQFKFYKKLADTIGAPLVLPVYPKAPAHHVGEVQEMLLDRYLYLVNIKEVAPQNIIIAGDAAGGGLVLSLLQRMRYQALPMPKQALLFSPWLDVTCSNPEMEEIRQSDPLLKIERLQFCGKEYAGDVALESPVVSPLYGDIKGLPPISVFTGTHDILSVDAIRLNSIAEESKLDVNVYVFPNQLHFFMGLPIPEAREVLEIVAEEVFGVTDEDGYGESEEGDELDEQPEAPAEEIAEEVTEVLEEEALETEE